MMNFCKAIDMHLLCRLDDIPEGQAKGCEIGDFKCFIVHKEGAIYAYQNRCPHLSVEMEWMPDQFLDSEGCLIQCSMHGALFKIEDGQCISGPCIGDQLTRLECVVKDEHIYLNSIPD